jgi:rubrerythrin
MNPRTVRRSTIRVGTDEDHLKGAEQMLYAGEELAALKERVARYPRPLLSAYLSVNPARPENGAKAYAVRLKDAMKAAGAPKEFAGRVVAYVDAEQPRASTLALFASQDEILDVYRLRVDLPERVRWGEPYVAPLIFALQLHEPHGVILLDAHKARVFVSVLGRIEEELDAENIFTTAGWREITISPSTAAPSGGAAKDAFEHRLEAQTQRFYKDLGETVRGLIERFGLARLILAGPEERASTFAKSLPRHVAEMVAATVPLPLEASEKEVMQRVSGAEELAQNIRQEKLLAEARERDARGLDETLESLQEGRVHHLLVPWPAEERVRWCDPCGLAFSGAKRCPYCGSGTRERELVDVVLELAEARGTRLEFVRGENANALHDELGGLAGLVRF